MSATSLSSSATACQSFSTSVDSMRILRLFISSGIRYFHTLSFSVSRNPFVCRSYENGRVYINNSHSGTPHTPFANRTSNLCGLTSVFSHSCGLFCTCQKLNSLVFKRFRTLCAKHVKSRDITYSVSQDILYSSVVIHRSTIVERPIAGLSSRTRVAQKNTSRRSSTLTTCTDSPDSALLIRHFWSLMSSFP